MSITCAYIVKVVIEITYFKGNDLQPSKALALHNMDGHMYRLPDLLDGSVHRRHCNRIVHNRDSNNEPGNADRTDSVAPATEQIHNEVRTWETRN